MDKFESEKHLGDHILGVLCPGTPPGSHGKDLTEKGRVIIVKYSQSFLHSQGTLSRGKGLPYPSWGKGIPFTPAPSSLLVLPEVRVGVGVREDIADRVRKKKKLSVEKHCEAHSLNMQINQKISEV